MKKNIQPEKVKMDKIRQTSSKDYKNKEIKNKLMIMKNKILSSSEKSLYKPHIKLAHTYWKELIRPGDHVIDATAGNGHDTYFLATLLQGKGALTAYDIQAIALEQTQIRLKNLSDDERKVIHLKLLSHDHITETDITLIVYNLGYLPRGNKSITTQLNTTLHSIERACSALKPGGLLSITCYPGHPEGKKEQQAIEHWASTLDEGWRVIYHKWKVDAPSLLLAYKP